MDKIIDAEVDSGDFEFEGIPPMGLEERMQKLEVKMENDLKNIFF